MPEPFLPCTTGIGGAHEWNAFRDECVQCGYKPPRRPFGPNRGIRDAPGMKASLCKRDGTFCRYCGATAPLTIEHLVPRARGGTNGRANLGIACSPCNNLKGNLTEVEFLEWVITGQLPLPKKYIELHRLMKNKKAKREALKKKYEKLHG